MSFIGRKFDTVLRGTSSGGGGIDPLQEDQILFGASDGSIDQSTNLTWDDRTLGINDGSSNIFIGQQSGNAGSSPQFNIGLGYQTLSSVTSGDGLVAIGHQALANNGNGDENVAIGFRAMQNTTNNAEHNVAIGAYAARSISGDDNVVIGYRAGFSTSSGSDNVFIGKNAGRDVTTGSTSVMIGYNAGNTTNPITGSRNIGIGYNTFNTGTPSLTGQGNIGIGYNVFEDIQSAASWNTALGWNALRDLTNANGNIAIGYAAGRELTTGEYNIIMGTFAMGSLPAQVTGDNNIVLGRQAAGDATSAYSNVCIGQGAFQSLTSGDYNVGLGRLAGYDITSGSSNVFIGNNVRGNGNASNQLWIHNDDVSDPLLQGDFNTRRLDINGRLEWRDGLVTTNLRISAGNITVAVTDYIIVKTANGGTITLPSTAATGQMFRIKDGSLNASSSNITVATAGSELIDGAATYVINQDGEAIDVVFEGANYYIL